MLTRLLCRRRQPPLSRRTAPVITDRGPTRRAARPPRMPHSSATERSISMSKILHVSLLPRLLFVCAVAVGLGLLGSHWWDAAPTLASHEAVATTTLPHPDHVVIVIEENHSYDQIIGASAAPYINRLVRQGALFTDAHGVQ